MRNGIFAWASPSPTSDPSSVDLLGRACHGVQLLYCPVGLAGFEAGIVAILGKANVASLCGNLSWTNIRPADRPEIWEIWRMSSRVGLDKCSHVHGSLEGQVRVQGCAQHPGETAESQLSIESALYLQTQPTTA